MAITFEQFHADNPQVYPEYVAQAKHIIQANPDRPFGAQVPLTFVELAIADKKVPPLSRRYGKTRLIPAQLGKEYAALAIKNGDLPETIFASRQSKQEKLPTPLTFPEPSLHIKRWIVLGLDPSMSRTGFAAMEVRPAIAFTPEEGPHSVSQWLTAGSIKPDSIDDPTLAARSTVWIRAKAIATYVREMLKQIALSATDAGLIICMEYPTPQNDYLWSVNRIILLTMFEDGVIASAFGEVRILLVNASTNRSIMGLIQRGNTNKGENILKAYEFIDKTKYPELDVESCDGVLMAIWGRHAASAMLGTGDDIPENFKLTLCRSDLKIAGNGRNAHSVVKGVMHQTEYWYRYQRRNYSVAIKDASNPKKSLSRVNFSI